MLELNLIGDMWGNRIILELLELTNNTDLLGIMFLLQMIPNSCATHALVSILLNCPELQLGKGSSYLL